MGRRSSEPRFVATVSRAKMLCGLVAKIDVGRRRACCHFDALDYKILERGNSPRYCTFETAIHSVQNATRDDEDEQDDIRK